MLASQNGHKEVVKLLLDHGANKDLQDKKVRIIYVVSYMYVCMYGCMDVYTNTHIHAYVYVYIHIYVCLCCQVGVIIMIFIIVIVTDAIVIFIIIVFVLCIALYISVDALD